MPHVKKAISDKDIEENPYLGEHSKFTMQFARDHGITMEEAYKHPVVKSS